MFVDINPDTILDEPGEIFGIDLDAGGINDFNFFDKSFTTTVFYDDIANVKPLFAGAFDTMQNGIMGSTGYLSGFGGYTYFWPYPLSAGQLISVAGNFYNDNYQTLAMEIYKFGMGGPGIISHQGNWYPWYGDVTDHYLGIRFTDEENIRRYGWIRCSVTDSGRTLIIKDYAYESKPDVGILAGDTIGDTTTVSIHNITNLNAKIYSYNKIVTIRLQKLNQEATVHIYDIWGKEIYTS